MDKSNSRRFRPDASLISVERPGRYIGSEINSIKPEPDPDFRFCLFFPDIYDIGISYYGYQILYHILNSMEGVSCERTYLPWQDMQSWLGRNRIPLFSLESFRSLSDFDAIGITLQTELHYPGVVKGLDLAGITRYAVNRKDSEPLIIGGGPCAFHPEPVAPFFDAILIGDGEEGLPELINLMRSREFNAADRKQKWTAMAEIDGVYAPGLHDDLSGIEGASALKVKARVISSLKREYYPQRPIVPLTAGVHDRLTIEIMRGCTQGCRFCQVGMLHRPVRERSVADIIAQVQQGLDATGYDEVSLLSLSTSDYSRLSELLAALGDILPARHASLAFPSLRPSTFTEEMAQVETGGRKSGLTFAVEAGSQRLRDVINKDLTEEQLFETVERAWRHGWSVVKLYFMVGLPTEKLSDIDEGAALLNRLQKTVPRRKSLKVSVSPFIPKPHSIFENEEFLDIAELRDRQTQLLSRLNFRTVKTSRHDARMSRIETLLARGNRRMARVIEAVAEQDSGIEAWSGNFSENRWLRAFDEFLPDWSQLLQPINTDRNTAWAHISKGFTKRFMQKDLATANRGVTLPDCKTNECYNCGLKRSCEQMASETIPENSISRTVPLTKEDSDDPEVRYRYRLTFTKLLHARYLGHHDLMRAVTRSLMRAGLSLLYTQGFNPRPKVTYDQAIPLGFGTSTFWVEFETGYELEVGEWLGRLVSVFPSGVKPRCLEKVVKGGGEQTLMSDTRVYRLRFDRPVSVSEASNELLADDEIGLLNWQLDKTARTLTLKMQRRKGRKLKPVNVGEKLINRLDGDVRILSVTNLKVDAPLE